MSLAGRRAEFATALANVDGVKGYKYRPATPSAGDAWPLLGAMERTDGLSFYVTWRILVFLPQDERQASEWIDSHVDGVIDGVEQNCGFVDRVEPVVLASQAGDQLALQITMRSE